MSNKTATILVVDDTPSNIDVLSGILRDRYAVKVATTGERALTIAGAETPPDLILLDIMMPGMDGYETCRRLKSSERTRRIPVIFVTAFNEIDDEAAGFAAGCVDYITKPVSPVLVLARVATQLALYDQERHLQALVADRTRQLERTRLEVIRRLGRAAEYKDDESGLHVLRIGHYARLLARAAGAAGDFAEVLFQAAPLHDVGKIGIAESILAKTSDLTAEESAQMRRHTIIGASIIGKHEDELLETARVIALTHHEHWDGSGFPRGLKGEEIPLAGRITTLCDVFDTLTSERPYKKEWPVENAVAYLREESGRRFDPRLVDCFVEALPEVLKLRDQYSELPVAAFR